MGPSQIFGCPSRELKIFEIVQLGVMLGWDATFRGMGMLDFEVATFLPCIWGSNVGSRI